MTQLNSEEQAVLRALSRDGAGHMDAKNLAREVRVMTSYVIPMTWQKASRVAGMLVRLGLAERHQIPPVNPRMTWYEVTDDGRSALLQLGDEPGRQEILRKHAPPSLAGE